ncbi:GntR family transcriptional regulator [Geodermatophilus ruber]|uniref:Transcriptional regulator, GntR family n=1 Tax=Geodermatophilus ruber TaxID=504800 RepID=A0A1I4ACS7_9ACTN|nr:GntR family transcriptional regulator [Geodermatophilus ruber]SFK54218.1 transcriptional regulator, GntR family [Geodermatophilus ruber]
MADPPADEAFTMPPTRREAVLRRIRTEIVTGVLPPGTVLKDAEVAARLGVSITPVREAIAQLAAEGLIDIAPNRSRRVTQVTQKNALELIDVMAVLACAGFEWGVPNLTPSHLQRMRVRLDEFVANLRAGNLPAASAAGADFSTIVILASGNRELQTHVDLVVARTLRLIATSAGDDIWQVWVTGYRETLELLEADRPADAVARYRQIYVEYRALVETMLFRPPGC